MSVSLPPLLLLCLFVLCAGAALTDARSGLIPNWLTLPCLAFAPLVQLFVAGPGASGRALLSAAVCGSPPLLLFSLRAMGGGDVKLFAALGAIAGVRAGLEIQLLGCVLGAGYASCVLAARGALFRTLARSARLLLRPLRARGDAARGAREERAEALTGVRLGVPVLAGALLWLLVGSAEGLP